MASICRVAPELANVAQVRVSVFIFVLYWLSWFHIVLICVMFQSNPYILIIGGNPVACDITSEAGIASYDAECIVCAGLGSSEVLKSCESNDDCCSGKFYLV